MARIGLHHGPDTLRVSQPASEAPVATKPSVAGDAGWAPTEFKSPPGAATPGQTTSTLARFTQGLFRTFTGAVAGVILGAAALPAMAGAQVLPETSLTPDSAQVLDVRSMTESVAHDGVQVAPGPVGIQRVFQDHLQHKLRIIEAQQRQFEAQSPADPVLVIDHLKLHEVVAQFHEIMSQDAVLPAGLLADLDHILTALQDAQPGEFKASFDRALLDLPSQSIALPSVAGGGVQAPAAPHFKGPGQGLIDALSLTSPTDFPDQAQGVIAAYTQVMSGVQASISQLPDFQLQLQNPLVYNGSGAQILIPAGAQLVHSGDDFSIESNNLLWAQNGLTVVSEDASLNLGPNLDGLQAKRITASGQDWSADLQGATVGVSRGDGSALIQADHLDLDLVNGSAELTGARLLVGPSGNGTLDADQVAVTRAGFALDLSGLHAEQTREGTHLMAAEANYGGQGALIHAEAIDIQFGAEGATMASDLLHIESGGTKFDATNAVLSTKNVAQGGQLLQLQGDTFSVDHGETSLNSSGKASLQIMLDSQGQMRSAKLAGDAVSVTTAAGHAELIGSSVNLNLDKDGHLKTLSARSQSASFAGSGYTVDAQRGKLDMSFDAAGQLSRVTSDAAKVAYAGDSGAFDVERGNLTVDLKDGLMSQLSAQAAGAHWRGTDGTSVDAERTKLTLDFHPDTGTLGSAAVRSGRATFADAEHKLDLSGLAMNVTFDSAGLLTGASAQSSKLTYQSAEGTFFGAGDVKLQVQTAGEHLDQVLVSGKDIRYTGDLGELSAAQGALTVDFAGTGHLEHVRFETEDLRVSGDYGTLGIQGDGTLDAVWSEDGQSLRRLTGDFDGATYTSDFGDLALSGGTGFAIEVSEAGATNFTGQVTQLDLAHSAGQLQVDGAQARGTFAPDGTAETLSLSARHLAFTGTAEGNNPLSLDLQGPQVDITQRAEGGQRLSFGSDGGNFSVNGHQVGLEGAQQVVMETTTAGEIDTFAADFPGQVDFVDKDGELSVVVRDAHANYEREGSKITLDFEEIGASLRGEGLEVLVQGVAAELDETHLSVRVDRAEVLRTVGEQLNVEVEALTLDVTRNGEGALKTFDLGLGGLDAQIDGMNVMVRTPSGEQVRLHVSADEEGRTIKAAYLQIPDGGEIRITKDDFDLKLGGQRLAFSHDDDGVYRFRADGLDATAITKDAEVRVEGGTAQVSLDPESGRLVIDEITGTHVEVKLDNGDLRLDVEELRNFMVSMTSFEGGATGGAIHLIPTTDGSTISASLHGEVSGIPVEISVDNAHELQALAQISVNQVHVFVGDSSGQGNMQIGIGPVKIEGSALEVIGRYHPYDPARMTESVHQFLTTSGQQLFSGINYEADGVLRLGTDREGLNGELAVLLPADKAMPGYRFNLSAEPSSAYGLIGSVGYRMNDVTLSAFGGLVPGSHATLHVKQGDVEVGGFSMPKQTDLPTTVMGGLRLDMADVDGGHLGVVGGAYMNPAGLAETSWVTENNPFGAFAGIEYAKDNWTLSGSAVVDIDRNGNAQVGGAMLQLGIKF